MTTEQNIIEALKRITENKPSVLCSPATAKALKERRRRGELPECNITASQYVGDDVAYVAPPRPGTIVIREDNPDGPPTTGP
jgi:hypothetical protein